MFLTENISLSNIIPDELSSLIENFSNELESNNSNYLLQTIQINNESVSLFESTSEDNIIKKIINSMIAFIGGIIKAIENFARFIFSKIISFFRNIKRFIKSLFNRSSKVNISVINNITINIIRPDNESNSNSSFNANNVMRDVNKMKQDLNDIKSSDTSNSNFNSAIHLLNEIDDKILKDKQKNKYSKEDVSIYTDKLIVTDSTDIKDDFRDNEIIDITDYTMEDDIIQPSNNVTPLLLPNTPKKQHIPKKQPSVNTPSVIFLGTDSSKQIKPKRDNLEKVITTPRKAIERSEKTIEILDDTVNEIKKAIDFINSELIEIEKELKLDDRKIDMLTVTHKRTRNPDTYNDLLNLKVAVKNKEYLVKYMNKILTYLNNKLADVINKSKVESDILKKVSIIASNYKALSNHAEINSSYKTTLNRYKRQPSEENKRSVDTYETILGYSKTKEVDGYNLNDLDREINSKRNQRNI